MLFNFEAKYYIDNMTSATYSRPFQNNLCNLQADYNITQKISTLIKFLKRFLVCFAHFALKIYLRLFQNTFWNETEGCSQYSSVAAEIGAIQAKFHEFGSRGIWDTVYHIYVVKSLVLWQNKSFYYINRVYRILNTPGTKFMKFGLKCSNLHFKKNKTIKFEPTWDWFEPSLESLQRIHVK